LEERFVFLVAVNRSRWWPFRGDISKEELAVGIWIIVFYHLTALSSVSKRSANKIFEVHPMRSSFNSQSQHFLVEKSEKTTETAPYMIP
jgi:hypothetical protein